MTANLARMKAKHDELGKRVIRATRSNKFAIPDDFDSVALGMDLDWTFLLFQRLTKTKPSAQKATIKALETIERRAVELAKALEADAYAKFLMHDDIDDHFRMGPFPGSEMIGIKVLVIAEFAEAAREKYSTEWAPRIGSPFEQLVGGYFRRIFERHFGTASATRPRSGVGDHTPNSPFIRFTEEALSAAGVFKPDGTRYSREAILSAYKRMRKVEISATGIGELGSGVSESDQFLLSAYKRIRNVDS